MFLFLFFSMLSLCSFFRLKELFQVKNVVTTSLLFVFFENAKNLGWTYDGKRIKKKRMALAQSVSELPSAREVRSWIPMCDHSTTEH